MIIKVPKARGEGARRRLQAAGIWDPSIEIGHDKTSVYLGVKRRLTPAEKKTIGPIAYSRRKAKRRLEKPRSFLEALKGKLTKTELAGLKTSFDVIGDIAVLLIPDALEKKEAIIAKAVLSVHSNVQVVCKRAGAVEGEFRVRPLEIIAGPERTVTTYREHGCIYRLDLAKMFFTPRLATERERIAKQVRPGETVVDMFAGVGPFSILIAKKARPKKVYAIDLNKDAYEYLKRNVELNDVAGVVEPLFGDANEVCRGLKADRVIMNLPKEGYGFLPAAIGMLKKGTIHYHCFGAEEELPEIVGEVRKAVEAEGRKFKLLGSRLVRQISPREWNVALDFEVS